MKLQRKNAGGRESVQHLNHLQPKPSSVQSAVRSAHQESDSTATNEDAGTDNQLPQNSLLQGISQNHSFLFLPVMGFGMLADISIGSGFSDIDFPIT